MTDFTKRLLIEIAIEAAKAVIGVISRNDNQTEGGAGDGNT